ncbi:23S rRNA (guanosine(2251)-2'-O)-methyltransferase RlmB [Chakrabartyella piscis]|uniref:23S rRNA (guanosine(2251)-2'-O)-methyltransferase RlmB n=1 Tax=Chakrabartyella piscis TaxID=2918914 RepID=UPI0029587AC0|nr:23S rRNA (guanosine(2251)-2'-O)-methyltransferase RlmB [Chakrabartyella piscis]
MEKKFSKKDRPEGKKYAGMPDWKAKQATFRVDKYADAHKEENANQFEGRNAVLEVIKSGRDVEKLMVQKGNVEGSIKQIVAMALEKGIVLQETSRQKMDEISQTKNHQGVIIVASAHEYVEVEDILALAKEKGEDPFILILDGLTDPHNLGAILRTAECSGVHGVIIPKRRSVGLTATVGKTSAGAVEYMPVARVTNITKTMEYLKKEGLWVGCSDMRGSDYFDSNMTGPLALVIGSEGDGASRLVKDKCDFTVAIPMYGKIESLNASVAAGLLMYEVVRQRNFKK